MNKFFNNPPRPSGTPPFKRRGIRATLLLFCSSAFLLFCFSALLLLSGCTKTKYEFHNNGKIKSETHYRFGKETGTTTYYHFWYPTKTMEVEMKRGKKHGQFVTRYFDGNVEVMATYKNDLKEGKETHYYKSGQRTMEVFYTHGLKNGPITTWYSNGVVRETGAFVNDLYDGEWEYYNDLGLIIGEGSFSKGTGKRTSYDERGRLQMETNYVNNLKEGIETHYLPSGEVAKTYLFKADRIIEINGVPVDSL